jgi:hypothetical protein
MMMEKKKDEEEEGEEGEGEEEEENGEKGDEKEEGKGKLVGDAPVETKWCESNISTPVGDVRTITSSPFANVNSRRYKPASKKKSRPPSSKSKTNSFGTFSSSLLISVPQERFIKHPSPFRKSGGLIRPSLTPSHNTCVNRGTPLVPVRFEPFFVKSIKIPKTPH